MPVSPDVLAITMLELVLFLGVFFGLWYLFTSSSD
jgi:hypothetical protein